MHRHLSCAAFACAVLTAPLVAQARGLGYAVDSDDTNHLWAIDLSSGNAADLGPTGRSDIEALAFHPDGRLFGIEDGEEEDLLVLLDLRSGAATVIGSLGAPVANPGFAIDATGAAWVASDGTTTGERPFYALDLASGRATLVGDLGRDIQGLMAAGRSIYGINDEEPGLFRIDTRRGTAELLATLGAPFEGECPSLEIAPNGDWIALNDAGAIFLVDPASGSAAQSTSTRSGFESLAIPQNQVCAYAVDSDNADQLHAIDLRTGASVTIGNVGFTDVEGLAFSSEGRLFGIDDDGTPELLEIDLVTGIGRSIGALGVAISNPGFAIDASGAGYVLSDTSTGPLHRIDLATGAATFVGNSGTSGVGLAFLRGELFSLDWDPDQLARLDPATSNATVIGALQNINLTCGGLDATSDGTLWGLDDLGRILLVSPTSGTALHVASTLPNCEGLAIPPGCGAGPYDARCLELDLELPLPTVAALGGPAQTIALELELPFATLPENLAGLGVELFANGLAISPIMVLDEKGRGRSEAGSPLAFDVALSAKKRTLSASLTSLGFRAILGLPTAVGRGSSIVELRARVLVPIDGLPGTRVARCRVPFTWENLAGDEITGGYAPKSEGPSTSGFARTTKLQARQVGDTHDLSLQATLLPNGGAYLSPALATLDLELGLPAVRVRIGDAAPITVPASAIERKGTGAKETWSLRRSAGIPQLSKLSYSAKKGVLSLAVEDLAGTGIPLALAKLTAEGGALAHPLEVAIEVLTAGGWQSFYCGYVLTRKDASATSWK
ncbi:MAG: hypothetical protein JNM84_11085 [Planctomycetes bacterium]|nr:hypothetical protein [Planctomycetota bacterium]